jgi:hypothetical protein
MLKQMFAIALLTGTAHAGEPIPRALANVCGDRLADATGSRLAGRHDEEMVYEVSLPKGKHELVIGVRSDNPCGGEDVCEIVPMGKPDATLAGKLGRHGKRATAAVYLQPDCAPGNCASVLILRAGDTILDAISTGECDPRLSALALTPGQDAIELLCASQAGAGDRVAGIIYTTDGGALRSQLAFDAGATEPASDDEREAGQCTIRAIGAAAMVKTPAGPRLRVTRAPESGQGSADGSGPACKRQQGLEQDYRWDAAAQKLVADGDARRVVRSTCDCTR